MDTKKAILCVDDEELILRNVILDIGPVAGEGVQFEVAASEREALDVMAELRAAGVERVLVLSDLIADSSGDFSRRAEGGGFAPVQVQVMRHSREREAAAACNPDMPRLPPSALWERDYLLALIDDWLEK